MSRIDEIKSEITKLKNEMADIQRDCSHPKSCRKLINKYENNRMNYDLQEVETYSITSTWLCTLCEKSWEMSERQ